MPVHGSGMWPFAVGTLGYQPAGLSASLDNLVDNNPNPPQRVEFSDVGLHGPLTEFPNIRVQRGGDHQSLGRVTTPGQGVWYGQVHVLPTDLDLGNILSSQVRQVTIWNPRYMSPVSVTAVNNNVGQGVTISNISPPETVEEFSDIIFDVSISTEGAPSLSGTIDVVTDAGTLSIDVSGQRVIAWQFRPRYPIQERLRFQTDVIEHDDGSEQRNAMRNAPEQTIKVSYRKRNEGRVDAQINNILFEWLPRLFGVPMFWEESFLNATLAAGSTTIPIDPDSADYKVGGLVILIDDEESTFEVQEITAVNAGASIEIATPGLINTYAINASVAPVRLCLSEPVVEQRLYRVGAEDTAMTFVSIDSEPIESIAYDTTYKSIPVFDDPNIISGRIQPRRFTTRINRTTFGRRPFTRERGDRSAVFFGKQFFSAGSKAELWKLRSWMHQLKGSQGVFYVPSFHEDFDLQATVAAGSTTIDVRNAGFTTYVEGREPRGSIDIELHDGTVFRRDVTSSTIVDATTERLGIDTSLGQEVQPSDVRRIMTLWLCRIADDKVDISHNGNFEANVAISVKAVRA